MKNIDSIIEQIKQGIEQQKRFMTRINPETEDGQKSMEWYQNKIAELEYRMRELEEKKRGNTTLAPHYNDGKYASYQYKETMDMLRVCYYHYFQQDPSFSPVPKRKVMFDDPTLFIPVDTYRVKGKFPFQIMFTGNYLDHKADPSKAVSIKLPFEILSNEKKEEYLRCALELIKLYSGNHVNLVLGDGMSLEGSLSYIADETFSMNSKKEINYYQFFDRLCDNNIRNIIYIGDSMKKGVSIDVIDNVQNKFVNVNQQQIERTGLASELEKSNKKIKKRILSINNRL